MGCAVFGLLAIVSLVGYFDWASRKRKREMELAHAGALREILEKPPGPEPEFHPIRAFAFLGNVYFPLRKGNYLVAIDFEIKNEGPSIKLDDFEILNGESGRSYGDKPHIIYLTSEGQPLPEETLHPASDKVRLVFQVPNACHSVNLRLYADEPLFPSSLQIQRQLDA